MAEENQTWSEKLLYRLAAFETYLEEMKTKIYNKHADLINKLEELVELSKQVYEPGMDYYGVDYLNQMGVGLKVKELEDMTDPLDYEKKLDELLKDTETRIFWMKRDIEAKAKSATALQVAKELNVPLIKMDMDKVFDKYESEQGAK
jgi:hypothetical protein